MSMFFRNVCMCIMCIYSASRARRGCQVPGIAVKIVNQHMGLEN